MTRKIAEHSSQNLRLRSVWLPFFQMILMQIQSILQIRHRQGRNFLDAGQCGICLRFFKSSEFSCAGEVFSSFLWLHRKANFTEKNKKSVTAPKDLPVLAKRHCEKTCAREIRSPVLSTRI